jgi:hypothetical protein
METAGRHFHFFIYLIEGKLTTTREFRAAKYNILEKQVEDVF